MNSFMYIIGFLVLVGPFAVVLIGARCWWFWSNDRWWMHLLFVPALAVLVFVLFVVLYYLSINPQGGVDGGLAIALLPLYPAVALAIVGYLLAFLRRAFLRRQ